MPRDTWKEDNYAIVREVLHPQLVSHLNSYLKLQRKAKITLDENRWLPPKDETFGVFNDEQIGDPNTWSKYGDIAIESLFDIVTTIMNAVTKSDLIPTYGYTRIYSEGAELKRHKDRFSCEISTTINLGGPEWPIFVEPDVNKGKQEADGYKSENTPGVPINLGPGDIMIYRGNLVEHWREPLVGTDACQCFLHYNDSNTDNSALNAADTRKHLGLPASFRTKRL